MVSNITRMVSAIHVLWGVSMFLITDIPRPFGAFEPFLSVMNQFWLGMLFTSAGIIALLNEIKFIREDHKWLAAWATVPQQTILMWGFTWAAIHLVKDFDTRLWFASVYLAAFAIFHAFSVTSVYKDAFLSSRYNVK